jgi:hypothetical protein
MNRLLLDAVVEEPVRIFCSENEARSDRFPKLSEGYREHPGPVAPSLVLGRIGCRPKVVHHGLQ